MKKLSLSLIVLFVTITLFAYDVQIDGIYYNLNHKTNTAEVTHDGSLLDYNGAGYNESKIIIPQSIIYPKKQYNVTSIRLLAFLECKSIKSISIPSSITEIGEAAFLECLSLNSIIVNNNNKKYASIDGVLYNKDFTKLICCPSGTNLTSIQIPNSVTSIESRAFANCVSLTSVTIPNGVTKIDFVTFAGCTQLHDITISPSVKEIAERAFDGCTSLTSITLPNSITQIGEQVFKNCSSLKYITCLATEPPCISYIPDYKNCTLYIPNGTLKKYQNHKTWSKFHKIRELIYKIDSIYYNLDHENKIAKITYPYEWESNNYSNFTSITIPTIVTYNGTEYNVTSIDEYAFSTCTKLRFVKINASITEIAKNAFNGCENILSITIENKLPPMIYKDTFNGVANTIQIIVPHKTSKLYKSANHWNRFTNYEEVSYIKTLWNKIKSFFFE